jgi:hypothetical protein
MIRQYLSQTNESATVPKIQNFCQLNKALVIVGGLDVSRGLEDMSEASRYNSQKSMDTI